MKSILSSPYVQGMTIGLLVIVSLLIMDSWFPGVTDRHERLVRDIAYTVISNLYWTYRLWAYRRRGAFWVAMASFFLIQLVGVLLYSTRVHPLRLWEWAIVFGIQSIVIRFLLEGAMRRLNTLYGHLRHDRPLHSR